MQHLTPVQQEAVEHIDGPLLILAGPGSGKTRVITHRIVNLLHQGISGRRILALTFTNKAADEMRTRVEHLTPGQGVTVSTFHRFCARLLRQYAALVGLPENYSIYDTRDSRQLLRKAIESFDCDFSHFTPERIASAISWAKNNLISPEDYQPREGSVLGTIVGRIYPAYQSKLLACGAVDFDDLLLHVAMLLRDNGEIRASLDQHYKYIMVDEYQDTNLAQYTIVRALSIDNPNLAVTGDPDQSIYGWRGANLSNILDFEKDFRDVFIVRLEQNYRSTKRILHVADQLIRHNKRRKKKSLFTDNVEGSRVSLKTYPNQRDEASIIASQIATAIAEGKRRPQDFAIFYRVNALSRSIEFSLRDHGIPYQMVNGLEFFQRREIKDILAYLHLVNNPRNDIAFLRVVNRPARAIGRTTLERLAEYAQQHALPLLEAAYECGQIEKLNKRAVSALKRFVGIYGSIQSMAHQPLEEVVGHVLAKSGYQEMLKESDDEEDLERLANIEELLTVAREFDIRHPDDSSLEAFLEETSLVNDVDAWDTETDRVTLMTLHASKGLEFPVVHIVALEEGLLPHERSRDDPAQLEEERRLLFVGITRAQEELYLSLAAVREYRGQRRVGIPSQFLMELPHEEMDVSHDEAAISEDLWDDSPEWNLGTPIPSPVTRSATMLPSLLTAADLAGTAHNDQTSRGQTSLDQPPRNEPDTFCQGMVVRHPEYGLGKIVALSGNGDRRMATVTFFEGAGQKKFIVKHSPLQPVKSK